MPNREHSLLYHAMHSRPMPGCLPLFFVLAAVVVGSLMLLVDVQKPDPARPKGHGKVTYRSDAITAMRMQLRSPLPLLLPVYADPTRKDMAAGQTLPRRFEPAALEAPPQAILPTAPASIALDEEKLLALPPTSNDGKEAPTP